MSVAEIINERRSSDGTRWQARRSTDRGRLEVIAVVPPSTTETVIAALTAAELRQLLEEPAGGEAAAWRCRECLTVNEPSRHWCRSCSAHEGAE